MQIIVAHLGDEDAQLLLRGEYKLETSLGLEYLPDDLSEGDHLDEGFLTERDLERCCSEMMAVSEPVPTQGRLLQALLQVAVIQALANVAKIEGQYYLLEDLRGPAAEIVRGVCRALHL
jgi:hypothetical protein